MSLPGSILIINSMGWVEGIFYKFITFITFAGAGLSALQYIVEWTNPNYCFQIRGKEKLPVITNMFIYIRL